MRSRPAWTVLSVLLALGCGGPTLPNIVFIFTDDHASHSIGAYGSVINQTPNLDRLAREGMLFRNAFVTNSICAPSRATVLTGQYGHLNGVPTNRDTLDLHNIDYAFPKLLRAAGYETAVIGKWHLKLQPEGFDHYEVLRGQGLYYNPLLFTPDDSVQHTGYTTDIITDRAIDWLANRSDPDQPFLLMYQHKAPHRRWDPGPDHLTLYDDLEIPEPATLFDDYTGRTSAALTQEMTIRDHMDDRDLKFVAPPELTDEQRAVWDAAYDPKNEAFRAANLQWRRPRDRSAGATQCLRRLGVHGGGCYANSTVGRAPGAVRGASRRSGAVRRLAANLTQGRAGLSLASDVRIVAFPSS